MNANLRNATDYYSFDLFYNATMTYTPPAILNGISNALLRQSSGADGKISVFSRPFSYYKNNSSQPLTIAFILFTFTLTMFFSSITLILALIGSVASLFFLYWLCLCFDKESSANISVLFIHLILPVVNIVCLVLFVSDSGNVMGIIGKIAIPLLTFFFYTHLPVSLRDFSSFAKSIVIIVCTI